MKYKNRRAAGKYLAKELEKNPELMENSVIIAIPRGGVPVAYAISKNTQIPFYLIVTKKLTRPQNPEVAIGAIAPDGSYEINKRLQFYGIDETELEEIRKTALQQINKRIEKYTNGYEPILKNKKIIVVDDGIATGYTALVTRKYVMNRGAKHINLAIPVGPKKNISKLTPIFDEIICPLKIESYIFTVSRYYKDFHQNTDKEIYNYLTKAKREKLLYDELE
jgi:predicted phosphoribosyltransferase